MKLTEVTSNNAVVVSSDVACESLQYKIRKMFNRQMLTDVKNKSKHSSTQKASFQKAERQEN